MVTSFLIILALTGPEVGPGSPTIAGETARGGREGSGADPALDRWEADSILWLMRWNELGAPGTGPLAPAVVADSAGRMTFVPADSLTLTRPRGGVRLAFQSYPAGQAGLL